MGEHKAKMKECSTSKEYSIWRRYNGPWGPDWGPWWAQEGRRKPERCWKSHRNNQYK